MRLMRLMRLMRVGVYVDAFNLYYGVVFTSVVEYLAALTRSSSVGVGPGGSKPSCGSRRE